MGDFIPTSSINGRTRCNLDSGKWAPLGQGSLIPYYSAKLVRWSHTAAIVLCPKFLPLMRGGTLIHKWNWGNKFLLSRQVDAKPNTLHYNIIIIIIKSLTKTVLNQLHELYFFILIYLSLRNILFSKFMFGVVTMFYGARHHLTQPSFFIRAWEQ